MSSSDALKIVLGFSSCLEQGAIIDHSWPPHDCVRRARGAPALKIYCGENPYLELPRDPWGLVYPDHQASPSSPLPSPLPVTPTSAPATPSYYACRSPTASGGKRHSLSAASGGGGGGGGAVVRAST